MWIKQQEAADVLNCILAYWRIFWT